MVSSAMSIQDETSGLHSTALYTAGSGPSLDAGAQSLTGEGHVLKIRKPYTITKQRERWTEEEHQKFLEALKLHGRAWRKIAEHVGTKTAVQIRSHAQKFFSKVARESNGDDGSSTEPIEIPPPRPKRKPLHPYPRKLVLPLKKDNPSMQEQPAGSMSPNSCLSEQENQSPTSVLSAVVSDALGSSASNVPNCSPSPISCADVSNDDQLTVGNDFEGPRDMPVSVKLELCTKMDAFVKEGSVEATSTRCLKLFGTTLLITDSTESSSSFACKLQISSPNHVNSNPNLNSIPVKKPTPLPWCAIGSAISFDFCIAEDSGRLSEVDDTDKNSGTESGSQSNKDDNRVPSLSNPNKRASSAKGFEPCKRCFLERDLQSSTVDRAEKEARRTSLCL